MIVPMKKASVAVLAEDKERLLTSLQKSGCLMLIKDAEEAVRDDASREENLIARTEKSLRLLEKYAAKEQSGKTYPAVSYDEFVGQDPAREALLAAIESADEEIARLKSDIQTLTAEIKTLEPWRELVLPPNRLGRNRSVVFRVGYVPEAKRVLCAEATEQLGAVIEWYGASPEGRAAVVVTFQEEDAAVMDVLRPLGFTETALPPSPDTIGDLIAAKTAVIGADADAIRAAETRLRTYAADRLSLEVLNDQTATAGERRKAPVRPTDTTVFVSGWVRVDRVADLERAVAEATDIYDVEFADPAADEVPPTAVKNNKFVNAFETITDMFARPSYNELDPNPVMSFWYWMLFGMMMADFGYGLVMIFLFAFLIKKMHAKGETLKLLRVLMYSGVTTAFWGVLFNSYFGASIPWMAPFAILIPMDEALKFLVLSLAVGVLHIFTGLIMKAANNFRKKDYLAIFADSLSWMLLIGGVAMLFLPGLGTIGKWLAIGGGAVIVLFAGRTNKNPFARIGSGLYALYGATGFMGDIVSYARILALALSSAVIAYVMNMLAGMIQGSVLGFILSLFVYVIGHIFNLVMGLLSAYVHTSRLQFIEFFTKFYDGAGYEFTPLALKLKYIDKVNDEKA